MDYGLAGFDNWLLKQSPEYIKSISTAKKLEDYFQPEERKDNDTKIIDSIFNKGYRFKVTTRDQSYKRERNLLKKIIAAIVKKSEGYKGKKDEVKNLFYEAYFTGSLMKLGHVIEKTLGKGTFCLIAEEPFSRELSR